MIDFHLSIAQVSPEEWVFVRSVNFVVAHGTVLVANIVEVVKTRRCRADWDISIRNARSVRVAFKTEEPDVIACQKLRVGRTVRSVTGLTALRLYRCVLINEWSLFVCMALEADYIACHRITQRFLHKTAVLIVTV
jgi:hypothetical protein